MSCQTSILDLRHIVWIHMEITWSSTCSKIRYNHSTPQNLNWRLQQRFGCVLRVKKMRFCCFLLLVCILHTMLLFYCCAYLFLCSIVRSNTEMMLESAVEGVETNPHDISANDNRLDTSTTGQSIDLIIIINNNISLLLLSLWLKPIVYQLA